MATYNLNDFCTNIANAIRNKLGITDKIKAQDFASLIESIVTNEGAVDGVTLDENNYLNINTSYHIVTSVSTEITINNSSSLNINRGVRIKSIGENGSVSATNLTAENIKKGVTILGVAGTYTGGITPTGTAVPVNANVGTIYFNNKVGADYWYSKLESLNYLSTPFIHNPICPITFSSDGTKILLIEKYTITLSSGLYTGYQIGVYNLNTMTVNYIADICYSDMSKNNQLLGGKHIKFSVENVSNYSYQYGTYSISEYSGLPVGSENETLKDLISITPFE